MIERRKTSGKLPLSITTSKESLYATTLEINETLTGKKTGGDFFTRGEIENIRVRRRLAVFKKHAEQYGRAGTSLLLADGESPLIFSQREKSTRQPWKDTTIDIFLSYICTEEVTEKWEKYLRRNSLIEESNHTPFSFS